MVFPCCLNPISRRNTFIACGCSVLQQFILSAKYFITLIAWVDCTTAASYFSQAGWLLCDVGVQIFGNKFRLHWLHGYEIPFHASCCTDMVQDTIQLLFAETFDRCLPKLCISDLVHKAYPPRFALGNLMVRNIQSIFRRQVINVGFLNKQHNVSQIWAGHRLTIFAY